jgi:uncharacterized RDD family membrane protein YckC
MTSSESPLPAPGIPRRLASMLYDSLLLTAVLFIAVFAFSTLTTYKGEGPLRLLFQFYIVAIIAAYFIFFWRNNGQTLAMKTWRIKLVSTNGKKISVGQCLIRMTLAAAGIALAGVGLWWALFDRDKQFLHDRIAGTRLVLLEKNAA